MPFICLWSAYWAVDWYCLVIDKIACSIVFKMGEWQVQYDVDGTIKSEIIRAPFLHE